MKSVYCSLLLLCVVIAAHSQQLSLSGNWSLKLDSFQSKQHQIHLPGTLDDARIGIPVKVDAGLNIASMAHLTRKVQYTGTAHYTRTFTVPNNWKGRKILLTLGRVLWVSSVAIDGNQITENKESLSMPHRYDLTAYIKPGRKNTITISIDNRNIYPGINIEGSKYVERASREMAHAYTNHTQIKWNGILGEITLRALPATHTTSVAIFPNFNKKEIRIRYQLKKPENALASLTAFVTDKTNGKRWPVRYTQSSFTTKNAEVIIPFANDVAYWDEFNPRLYQLTTIVKANGIADTNRTDFGLRHLYVHNENLFLNSNRLFIRGNLECIIFPKTGYPPMQEKEWEALYTQAKSYGLNSFRFHSWCPPAAAFAAADKLGFYLQVELPHWNLSVGKDTAAFRFLTQEAFRIIDEYGNHPSFLFFSMGNELEGDFEKLNDLVASLKQADKRHLYSTTTFTFQKGITGAAQSQDDFFVTQWTKKGWVRGQGVFNDRKPDFSADFRNNASGVGVPIISHEIGQYSVYPDVSEIAQYKGNLVPENIIAVRNDLQKKGLLPLANDFLQASGKFAALLYKEEIERALKTKEFDGFQLLQLQDFPGQGTALVGLLNAFWGSKGIITAKEFRRYCSPVVPLIRFEKAIYQNNETFCATVELANFLKPLNNAAIAWKIKDESGKILGSGTFAKKDYWVDNGLEAGEIKFPLAAVTEAKKLSIEVTVAGTDFSNNWSIWVYPATLSTANEDNVVVTSLLQEAVHSLQAGRNVLLCPPPDTLLGVTGKFVPVFWSPVHFPDQPGTMGLLIKAKHKALRHFPTDTHSNWQWWDLTTKSKGLVLENMPDEANIVRPIDNFMTNKNISSLFEGRLGNGKLIVCSMDIISNLEARPQAKQLQYSLLRYMNSTDFNPSWSMDEMQLKKLFK